MLNNLKTNKILWSVTTVLTLIASLAGIVNRNIYNGLFPKDFIPGALPQDILTAIICIFLFLMIARTEENSLRLQVIIIGIIASFFYLYGIFTIERVYNAFYILYAAVFAMSFWSVLYSLMNLKQDVVDKIQLSSAMIKTSAISGLVIATLFSFLWISALIPLMRDHNRIEFLYSIYILDLCFVMPAFFITGILSLQKKGIGILLSPVIFIMGFFVIFPLGLNEVAKPYYDQTANPGAMIMSFAFSAFMLAIAFLQLKKMKAE